MSRIICWDYCPDCFQYNVKSFLSEGPEEKQEKLSFFERTLFSKEQQISKINNRIHNYVENHIEPPQALPILNELIQEIFKCFSISNLGILAQLNRHGKIHANTAIIKRATEFGYEGKDYAEAVKYINNLFYQISKIAKQKIIPRKYFFYKTKNLTTKNLDSERVVQNLKTNISTEDVFKIFSNEKLYGFSFKKIKKIFNAKESINITNATNSSLIQNGSIALILAVNNGSKNILELLLKHGADPNIQAKNGSPPLHWAAQAGYADTVELLLDHGARVNERAAGHATALIFACGYGKRSFHNPNAKVVELLLQHGADPNIPAKNGSLPLHWAARAGYADVVELLLDHGARVNERAAGHATALIFACGYGKRKVVELLLQHGADPNIPAKNGSLPLHWAARAGYADVVELLLDHGARVNERAAGHATALIFACGYEKNNFHEPNTKVVELLLQHGADPNFPAINGSPPLHWAAQAGHADIVKLFLDHGAEVNERAGGCDTALAFACAYGKKSFHEPNAKVVELLLQHGADPNFPAINGSPPLHWAAQAGHADIVKLFLDHGAEVNERAGGCDTALALACAYGKNNFHEPNAKVVELLLQHGADPNIPAINGSPPLHWAAQAGHADIVKLFLDHGAEVNERAGGCDTALAFTCGYGEKSFHKPNAKVVELLLKHGADPNIPAKNGSLPLHWAAQAGYADIVKLLLDHRAKVNERAAGYATALIFACGYGKKNFHEPNAKVVELLLQHGADPNIPAKNGSLPLHWAARAGYADVVELLLDHGAKVNERADEYDTALVFACVYGKKNFYGPNAKVVKLLLQHGADPNIPAKSGNPPLHWAAQAGYADIVKLLLEHGARANEKAWWVGDTALAFACGYKKKKFYKPNAKIVELLLKHGADPNIPATNGSPPLHCAAQAGCADSVKLLLDHGAKLNERAAGYVTALAFTCCYAHEPNAKVVELLLQHRADPTLQLKTEVLH